MYIGRAMPDEPTPMTEGVAAPVWVEPPVAARPRSLSGWIVSFLLLGLVAVMAVGNYFVGGNEEDRAVVLEQELQSAVSQQASTIGLSALPENTKESNKDAYQSIADDALKLVPKSERAAEVVVVASHEAGTAVPVSALLALAKSKDKALNEMAEIYGGDVLTQEQVERFAAREPHGFAMRLAQVQAKEMLELPSGRAGLGDRYVFMKLAAAFFVFLACSAGLLLFFVRALGGALAPVGFGAIEKSDGDRFMVRFASYLLIFALVSLLPLELRRIAAFKALGEVWTTAIALSLIGLGAVIALYPRVLGRSDSLREVVGPRQPFWKLVCLGLYGYACTVPLLVAVILVVSKLSKVLPVPSHPIDTDIANASGLQWLAIGLTIVVLAPLTEELVFRGLLLPALATQLKKPISAVLLCGFLFAAIHPQGPLIWPALMTPGAASAYLRYYTGSLVPCFVLHMVHNGVIFMAAYLIG